jgi:hypothetical protein
MSFAFPFHNDTPNPVDDADEIANDDTEMPFGSYGAHDDDGDAAVAKIFEDELKEETGKASSIESKKKKAPKFPILKRRLRD